MSPERVLGIVFAGLLGLIWGSFANVVAIRWHEGASLGGRSSCPACRKLIRPRHLVPVFSWLALRGRCADCGAKIHVQYPIVEAASCLLALIAAHRFDPLGPQMVCFWFETVISLGFIVPVIMDLRWKEVPVEYLAGLAIVTFIFQLYFMRSISGLAVAISIPVAFFGAQYLLSSGRWIGAGDVWIGAAIGAAAGRPALALVALYFSYLLGGGAALFGYVAGKLRRGDRLPFAPALAGGTLFMLWFGECVVNWLSRSYA